METIRWSGVDLRGVEWMAYAKDDARVNEVASSLAEDDRRFVVGLRVWLVRCGDASKKFVRKLIRQYEWKQDLALGRVVAAHYPTPDVCDAESRAWAAESWPSPFSKVYEGEWKVPGSEEEAHRARAEEDILRARRLDQERKAREADDRASAEYARTTQERTRRFAEAVRDARARASSGARFSGFDAAYGPFHFAPEDFGHTPSGATSGGREFSFGQLATDADYRALGVAPGASADEVKAAHRKKAMECHPDRGGSGDEIKAVNVARDRILRCLR